MGGIHSRPSEKAIEEEEIRTLELLRSKLKSRQFMNEALIEACELIIAGKKMLRDAKKIQKEAREKLKEREQEENE